MTAGLKSVFRMLLSGGLASALACSGNIVNRIAGATDGPAVPGLNPEPARAECSGIQPGAAPLRRLNRFEYNNTIRDLLKDTSSPANRFPPEELGNGFGNDAEALTVSTLLASAYNETAEKVVATATASDQDFEALTQCAPAALNEKACVSKFINAFGLKVFRAPVEADEAALFLSLFEQLRPTGSFTDAVRGTLQAMLQSPRFLYRIEFGQPAAAGQSETQLTDYEMAARLSYMLWSTMPDEALLAAAQTQQLASTENVRREAQRMLGDEKAKQTVRYFFDALFKLSDSESLMKNATDYPEFVGMAPLLKEEAERFLDDVIWNGEGKLDTLFTAKHSFMNDKVARYYGLSGPSSSTFERVQVNPLQRSGIMTQAQLLTVLTPGSRSNPTVRGLFVLERLMCDAPDDPPASLMVKEPEYNESLTTRERFAVHSREPSCAGCHAAMDPIGFTMENFDGVGRWRDTENNKPVDALAVIPDSLDIGGAVNGPIELAQRLGQSRQLRRCLSRQWFSFAYGRKQTEADACTAQTIFDAFEGSQFGLRDLFLAHAQTDAFLFRKVQQP